MNNKTRKYMVSFVLILTLFSLVFGGCASATDQTLSFAQLIDQAAKYNGKTVTLEAFYFSGFEISALAAGVGPASSGPLRIVPTGTLIWVKGGITQALVDKMVSQTATPSGYTEHIGKLKLTGQFETGKFGHLDAYDYAITITQAELLDWSPPPAAVVPPANSSLQIKITDLTGKPLEGAKVVSQAQPDGQLKVTGLTNADGIVTFNDIKSGDYRFSVSRFDFEPAELTLSISGNQTRSIGLAGLGETADDIVITPGAQAYRANVHQVGIENPWPSIQTVEVKVSSGSDTLNIRYRNNIQTKAGQTRNNLLNIRGGNAPLDINHRYPITLNVTGNPPGVTTTQKTASGLFGTIAALLVIDIAPDVPLGSYELHIGLNVDGKDYGTVPCTIEVIQNIAVETVSPSPSTVPAISREQAIKTASNSLPASIVSRAEISAERHGWYWEVTFGNLNAKAAELMPWPLKGPPPIRPGQPAPEPYPGIWQSVIITIDAQTGDLKNAGARQAPKPGPYIGEATAIENTKVLVSSIPEFQWIDKAKMEAYLQGDWWKVLFWEEGIPDHRINASVDAVTGMSMGVGRG